MKVLGLERFLNMIGKPTKKHEMLGVMLPEGSKVKRGDVIMAAGHLTQPAEPVIIEGQKGNNNGKDSRNL